MSIDFDKEFFPNYDKAVKITNNIQLLTARNPSPYTFHGTNTYIIGQKDLMILDPGPNNDQHFENLIKTVNGRHVSHIILTHSHADHSDLAYRVSQYFSAPIGKAPLTPKKDQPNQGKQSGEATSSDIEFDISLSDDMLISNNEITLQSIATPGHASDHIAFALMGDDVLFSGDHVMAWATTVIIPPDGVMQDYMASLEKLLERSDSYYLPGHGGVVTNPQQLIRGFRSHRKLRENAILKRLQQGDTTVTEIVAAIYQKLDPRLKNAAALSVWAHLIDLHQRNLIHCDTSPLINSSYSSR
ncbi:MBL fold metallo-hydrolase [Bartonella sp. HY761]|uniref:MBL fold metallo-hydrolase n=1 Tax=Bartonella sp. HY761 TaxID=2979330 RepID=UPI0021F99B12|nr:MBL fold metallo-hydrolase [Bartonella sp. HY761]UXN05489.1 MBL fold metallo-hydrolase [Bartonella sp. HY761]